MTPRFAICRYGSAALWAQPRPGAPLRSQLLLGEPVHVVELGQRFTYVRIPGDELTGYVRNGQLLRVSEREWNDQLHSPAYNLDLYAHVLGDRSAQPITFGARLPAFDGIRMQHAGEAFTYTGQAAFAKDLSPSPELITRLAKKWLYAPGMHGGRTPAGVHGAALLQLVFSIVGISLPRTANAMVKEGVAVDFMELAQAGDLAFFDGPGKAVDHVGLLLPDSTLLHVSDCVRIDAVDHFGIFDYQLGRYTHRLRIVKRHLPDQDRQGVLLSKKERLAEANARQLAIF